MAPAQANGGVSYKGTFAPADSHTSTIPCAFIMRPLAILLFAFQAAVWTEAYPKSDKEVVMVKIEAAEKKSSDKAGERFVRQNREDYLLQQYQNAAAAQQQQQEQQPSAQGFFVPGNRFAPRPGFVPQSDLYKYNTEFAGRPINVPIGPVQAPVLNVFADAQMMLQQDYHDAGIRAQIAGITHPRPQAARAPEQGVNSASPQIFGPAPDQPQNVFIAQRQPVDPEALQQYTQSQIYTTPSTPQTYATQEDARQQFLSQGLRTNYRSPVPQSQPQAQLPYIPRLPAARKPVVESASAQLAPSSQHQLLQSQPETQSFSAFLPQQQQYQPRPSHVQQPAVQYRYVQQLQQPDLSALFGAPTRGLFSPAEQAPSASPRPQIYLRPIPKAPAPTHEAHPTVRIPAQQRPISQAEFDALVQAGFNIRPVSTPEEAQGTIIKSKRAPLPLPTSRNHVTYTNEQDGVTYQYSPGSSEYNPNHKSKRFAPRQPETYSESDSHIMYVIAVRKPTA